MLRQYRGHRPGERKRWSDGTKKLRFFSDGATSHFPDRGTRIPNGWEIDPEQSFLPGDDRFWDDTNTLARIREGTRGASHARRAGCRKTCTSGSARGMQKVAPETG